MKKKIIYILIIMLSTFILSKGVYAYETYKIGDVVAYNDMDFYVIKDSGSEEDYITLLKAEPLTVEEVDLYGGVGTDNNHVNVYVPWYTTASKSHDINGYGGMVYYSSIKCGCDPENIRPCYYTECKNSYADSEIKYVVDAWAREKVKEIDLKEARLLTYKELQENLGFNHATQAASWMQANPDYTPNWFVNGNYYFWMMTPVGDSNVLVWGVGGGRLYSIEVYTGFGVSQGDYWVVRPVVELYKCVLDDSCTNRAVDNNFEQNDENKQANTENRSNNNINEKVKVPNTLKKTSELIMLVGLVLISIGINVFIIIKNIEKK